MRIGITERGDAGLDFSWYQKLFSGNYDGAILITKNTNEKFQTNLMHLYQSFPNILVHITCTGFGGTHLEPFVPKYVIQLNYMQDLLFDGFPADHMVLRLDPIIPTTKGLQIARQVLDDFERRNTGISRIRISLLDEYKHVKERLQKQKFHPFYQGFQPTKQMRDNTIAMLKDYPNLLFEACAEDLLAETAHLPNLIVKGCISETELDLFNLKSDPFMLTNCQNRNGCHCLSCKVELLTQRHRCPHQCLYCYWKD